jgi:hypothetical protein
MNRIALLAVVAILSGCAPHAVRVRCDAHLQPINVPVAASGSHSRSSRIDHPTAEERKKP